MRKYGIKNFKFEILKIVYDIDSLYSIESSYINDYNSTNIGYNVDYGGENHWKSELSEEDVVDIRERYNNHESKRNVYIDYKNKIGLYGFSKVWNGYTWKKIIMEVYTPENKKYHKFNTGSSGETNSRTKLTNDQVIDIRKRKNNNEKSKDVYNDFKDYLTYESFLNIWYNCNWKNIL